MSDKPTKSSQYDSTDYNVLALDDDNKPLAGAALIEFVKNRGGNTTFLQFSMGKDSISMWHWLRENSDMEIVPYFLYWFPNLSWQLEALDYYEEWFGQKIMRLPHPLFYDHIRNFDYQTPERIGQIAAFDLLPFDFADIENELARQFGLDQPYTAVGFRGSDNIDRRNLIIQKGAVGSGRRRYWFPIWDWNINDIAAYLKKIDVKLPKDYKYWGRTIGAWDYQLIKPIKEHFPDDWEGVIKFWLPLIDAEIFRHEVVGAYANGKEED